MREYNLFIIKDEYFNLYRNQSSFLFDVLKKLYNLKTDFNYGVTLYEQLCNKVSVDTLKYYLNSKYSLNNNTNFYIDGVLIRLKHTRIIIKSKYNLPSVIKIFNLYNKNIFVCDFNNNDYFWLSSFVKSKVLSYI